MVAFRGTRRFIPAYKDRATGPYHESDESSPQITCSFFKTNFNIILTQVTQVVSYLQAAQINF